MIMKNRINKILAFGFSVLLLTGCTNSFYDINTDPDAYSEIPFTNQLAYVIRNTGDRMGNDMDGYGTFAGYIVKIQYMDNLSGLIPSNNTYGNRWAACYGNNAQMKDLLEKTEANAEAFKNIRFVARIWQNFMWQYCTDGWGDIPYTEALNGAEKDGSILFAKYDKQEFVYRSVMTSLKEIADEMSNGFGSDEIGEGDFLFDGKVEKWQRFCNSLRLRMAMRVSGVDAALSKSTIEEICGNPEKYPYISENDEQCYLNWPGSAPYFEPWYNNKRTRDDHGLSDIFVDHLLSMDDPRLPILVKPAGTDGKYRGYPNGPEKGPNPLNSISRIGEKYRDDPFGFTPFYKACETYYILAEAAMLGYNIGMTAEEAYVKAVHLSMEDNGVDQAETDAYLAGKGKWNNTKERIWWDMWVALFKDNFEAWCLYRRTGVPTTNYPAIASIYGSAHNDQPFRLPYPQNQYQYNKESLDEVLGDVKDFGWGKQMWWDTRTGVK